MTEETIFSAALSRPTPAERAAYLDAACAGDDGLRRRVETLLASHAAAGFLDTPAVRLAAEDLAARGSDDTRTGPPGAVAGEEMLDFLSPSDKPGSIGRLGHYEVQEIVGRGGMGVVLKAFDENLHRVVAVKVMAPQLAASATARQRFTREARAAAAVTHDHLVTIHAVEESGGLPYIVMQYVDGLSLQDRLDRSGPLPLREVLRIGMQAASGLAAAHKHGLVHRDVKPANILLENGVERVKITDFGLARAADDASLTGSGVVAGTPHYMSPEQAEGSPVDARSDLFSLGSVLYATCAGVPPFRGSTARAVLKRVCEDTPRPLRDANAEVPEWLAAIVDRLHAKAPAERFQDAGEVAELLGRHLAHLQHPSQVAEPIAITRPPVARATTERWRSRWAVAAAVLVSLTVGLGLAEAAGVTKIRATVIRVFTPDGTLSVEVDDPDVKVTIEGDGGLVITGAGAQEVRVRPGSYKVQATKGGRPVTLDRDLVTISRGDRQIVRVRMEGAPAPVAPPGERNAFVVLRGRGAAEKKFDSLAEAVVGAGAGDTIEVRGNGPFVTEPVQVGTHSLVIRAGAGFRPVIRLIPRTKSESYLLSVSARLVLEGLSLQLIAVEDRDRQPQAIVSLTGGTLFVTNCRLASTVDINVVAHRDVTAIAEFRNSELLTVSTPCAAWDYNDGRVEMDNCILAGGGAVSCQHRPRTRPLSIRLTRNTIVGWTVMVFWVDRLAAEARLDTDSVRFDLSQNVIVSPDTLWLGRTRPWQPDPDEAVALIPRLPRLIAWREQGNLYPKGHRFVPHAPMALAEWNRLWGQADSGSKEGTVRFEGGNLEAKRGAGFERLAAADFRLHPDSAGYRAGADRTDLGADVDRVGPGAAYERWKKTPEYRQWLRDTGQTKK